jgi:hypothetical protein
MIRSRLGSESWNCLPTNPCLIMRPPIADANHGGLGFASPEHVLLLTNEVYAV